MKNYRSTRGLNEERGRCPDIRLDSRCVRVVICAALSLVAHSTMSGCSSDGSSLSDGGGPTAALPGTPVCPPGGGGGSGSAYPILSDHPYAKDYRLRVFGQVDFQGKSYQVVNAFPWDYL